MSSRLFAAFASCAITSLLAGEARAQLTHGALQCTQYLTTQGTFYGDPARQVWAEANALWLCDGASTPTNQRGGIPAPVRCFNQNLQQYGTWQQTIIACRLQRGLPISNPQQVSARLKAEADQIAQSQEQRQQQLQNGAPHQTPPALPAQPRAPNNAPALAPVPVTAGGQDPNRRPVGGRCVVAPDSRPLDCLAPNQQAAERQKQVTIAFTNQTNRPVDQHLLAPNGQRQFFYTLQPGETVDQISNPGVRWEFTADGIAAGTYETRLGLQQQYQIRSASSQAGRPVSRSPTPPVPTASTTVDGTKARLFDFGAGAIVKLDGNNWVEVDKRNGQMVFGFVQTDVSPVEVQLFDPRRQMKMRINLPERAIYVGYDIDTLATQQVYTLGAVSSESRVPGSTIAWETVTAPPALFQPPRQPEPPKPAPAPPIAIAAPLPQVAANSPPTQVQPAATAQPVPVAPPAGPGRNDPARAFEPGQYTRENRVCPPQKAQLGPGPGVMSQTLGSCSPFKTTSDEFIVSFRAEELVSNTTTQVQGDAFKTKVTVASNPVFQAWIDESGVMYVAMRTHPNSIILSGYQNARQIRGPFLRRVKVDVVAGPGEIEVETTFPQNGMGSSTVSRSQGINISATVGANAGPQMSGINGSLTVGWSDTTTATTQMDDFNIVVDRNRSARTFTWNFCGRAPMTGCYTDPNSLIVKGIMGIHDNQLHPVPPSAFKIDGFKNDIVYKITNRDTFRRLLNEPFSILVSYEIRLTTVRRVTASDGIGNTAQAASGTMKREKRYFLDLKELAKIVLSNPAKFGN